MAAWETNESWQPLQEKHKRNILGTASHETRPFIELTRIISVTAVFLARVSNRPVAEDACFRMRSLWESSLFVPWLILNLLRDVSGVVPESPWISGFMRKSSFTWVKWVGNVSLYRNYPQNIRNIRMYSVLYPESNFWWVFWNGSGMVPETFHNAFLGCSSKSFPFYCCQLSFASGCHFLGKILISC